MSDLSIGRLCDVASLAADGAPATLPADRLTTHAVCLGMTGSGKTGLCISLLEEVALAGVPVLAIDPKGDLANLALAFPELRAEDFAPWIDTDAASREGRSTADAAARTATRWKEGLASWGIGPERLRALADGTDVVVLTPGSEAGVPIDVLSALAAPPAGLADDDEGLRDYVTGAVGALLGLVGVTADPVRDPEAILLAQLLGDAWSQGRSMPLDALLPAIVDPPFDKVGVFPLDSFLPRKARMDLALRLNAILASPAFAAWRTGVPLDVDTLLAPRDGRTAVRVLYLAHLDDSQRMFFVTLLLHAVVAWSRRQPGTSALRALLYFDEVMGYLPPHPASPASKTAVLTLMKQARAVGLGTMLCTQNPVDVDYKALSNAGTWWIGRLQTAQDRDRVLDGLVGAGGQLDRSAVGAVLSRLPPRTFVWRDVKRDDVAVVHSRWAMSFLRGPLTRREVAALDQTWETARPAGAAAPAAPSRGAPQAAVPAAPADDTLAAPPVLPADLRARWLDAAVALSAGLAPVVGPALRPARADGAVVLAPALRATLRLTFDETGFQTTRTEHRLFFPLDGDAPTPHDLELSDDVLHRSAPEGARYLPLPTTLDEARELDRFQRAVVDAIHQGETDVMFRHKGLKLISRAGQTREAFDAEVARALRDSADARIAKLKDKVDGQVDRLQDKVDKAAADHDRYSAEASGKKAEELVNVGETLLSMFFGRRRSVTSVVSKRRSTMATQDKADRAEASIAELQAEIAELRDDTAKQIAAIEAEEAARASEVEVVSVGLERNDIDVTAFELVWVPVTRAL
ncbi:MAG: DUF853 family protein [Alphaproteobacteria bacterium]|nr:DUF853 family protein [Alphaproteobacteria bacterium]